MQIKDLSVHADLADVRGGVGNVTGTIVDASYNKNDSDIDFRSGALALSGGVQVSQLLDASKEQRLVMPMSEYRSDVFELGISASSFNVGGWFL